MTAMCLHCFVSGHVQGVFYRRYVREEAIKHGITGWARNLSDGRVEVLACGPKVAVEALQTSLWIGPTRAKVTDLQSEKLPWQPCEGFKVQ